MEGEKGVFRRTYKTQHMCEKIEHVTDDTGTLGAERVKNTLAGAEQSLYKSFETQTKNAIKVCPSPMEHAVSKALQNVKGASSSTMPSTPAPPLSSLFSLLDQDPAAESGTGGASGLGQGRRRARLSREERSLPPGQGPLRPTPVTPGRGTAPGTPPTLRAWGRRCGPGGTPVAWGGFT